MFLPLGQDLCVFQQPLGVLAGTGDTAGDLHLGEGGLARELVSLGLGRAGGGGAKGFDCEGEPAPCDKTNGKTVHRGGAKDEGTVSHLEPLPEPTNATLRKV